MEKPGTPLARSYPGLRDRVAGPSTTQRTLKMRNPARFRAVSAIILLLGLSPAIWPGLASADNGLKIEGFVDVSGSTLSLPLAHGAAQITIQVKLGIPAVQIPVQLTLSTASRSTA